MRLVKVIVLSFFLLPTIAYSQESTWKEATISGHANLEVMWCHCDVFFRQEDEIYMGAEYEILEAFTKYAYEKFGVKVTLVPNGENDVKGILEVMKSATKPNLLGTSLFSINPERAAYYELSEPYLPEFTVLVTHKNRPLKRKQEELETMLKGMKLLTMNGTSLEGYAHRLEADLGFKFPVKNARTTTEMLNQIEEDEDYFCIVDLPVYLNWVSKGHPVIRQNFYTYPGSGFGFLLTKGSDWVNPINHFILDPANVELFKRITKKYLGEGFYEFVNELPTDEKLGTSLLTKEKEIQQMLIENANLKIENNQLVQRSLLIGLEVSIIFLGIIGILFYYNRKNLRKMQVQQVQIETQQKSIYKKNEQLTQKNTQLLELNEEKNNLLSILAHDLRSPLSAILGFVEIAKQEIIIAEDINFTSYVSKEVQRMKDLIDKLLNRKTLDGEKSIIAIDEVNIATLAADVYHHYLPAAQKKQIRFVYKEDLQKPYFHSDPMILQMIIDNLISNAIKYSHAHTSISLEAKSDDQHVTFIIADQGPGFTIDDQRHMYKRFQQLSAKPTAGESSTGLGLAIVKKYVKELGGNISVKTEAGKGSEFTVLFYA